MPTPPDIDALEKRTLIYIHVPKAAGTTFSDIIEQNYPPREVLTILHQPGRTIEDFMRQPIEERQRPRVIKGHFPFGLHEHVPRPCTYITILRDPVARVLSHYYYVLRTPEHYLYDKVAGSKMSLAKYVGSPVTTELDNGQVRMISGCGRFIPIGQCGQQHLQQAKENLQKHFLFAGLVERFDETLLILGRFLEWKNLFYTRKNVTDHSDPFAVDLSVLQTIREKNSLDVELYAFVRNHFDAQAAPLASELKAFREANSRTGA
jgi:hypothetical protein